MNATLHRVGVSLAYVAVSVSVPAGALSADCHLPPGRRTVVTFTVVTGVWCSVICRPGF